MSGSVDSDRSSHRLSFGQAMTEFKLMFPDANEKVIEAVLRANRGAVEATIDQLLTMNTDSDRPAEAAAVTASDGPRPQYSAKVNRILELIGRDRLLTSGTSESSCGNDSGSNLSQSILGQLFGSKSSAKSSVDSKTGNCDPEQAEYCGLSSLSVDMSDDFVILENTADESQVFSSSTGAGDGMVGCFGLTPSNGSYDDSGFLPPTPMPPKPPCRTRVAPPLPPNMSLLLMSAGPGCGADGNPKKRWNPPLLGDLPDDFLRLNIGPHPQKSFRNSSAPTYQSTLRQDAGSMQDSGMQSGDPCRETFPLPSARIQALQPSSETGHGGEGHSTGNVI